MASQTLNSAFSLVASTQSDVSTVPLAILAQRIERLCQDHGLNTTARQQLHLFAVQTNALMDALWLYTMLLAHELDEPGAPRMAAHKATRDSNQGSYAHAPGKVKDRFFHNLANQTKIYAAAVGPCPLGVVAQRIAFLYCNKIADVPLPVFCKAQIAQLRQIAFERIQAAPALLPHGRRPKNDTGFWIAVDTKYKKLIVLHGVNYNASAGWRQWEIEIIAEDKAGFDDHTLFFDQAIISYHAPNIYPIPNATSEA
ncbi:hypothetical protein FRC07_002115 [Ceratobasidium sp. 392]|nr:hypothetical protein FRC07_002115 [Ceratobasidium sp. 392]